jgi:GTP cyclohydrolase II
VSEAERSAGDSALSPPLRCDCGTELDAALKTIAGQSAGALIYLRGHAGRGI